MSLPLNHWYRLGRKTFLLFLLRSGWVFILLFALNLWFTYHALWGKFSVSFGQFFIDRPNLYLEGSFVLEMLWLTLLGYLIVVVLRGWVLYRQYKFMLDENAFHVKRGIFFFKEIVIPYHHIQNVEILQPYLYRFISLAELDITTLSGPGVSASLTTGAKKPKKLLPIIDHKMARALATELINRGSAKQRSTIVEIEDDPNELTQII